MDVSIRRHKIFQKLNLKTAVAASVIPQMVQSSNIRGTTTRKGVQSKKLDHCWKLMGLSLRTCNYLSYLNFLYLQLLYVYLPFLSEFATLILPLM